MPLDPKDRSWIREWAPKLGITAYLLFVLAFMASHPLPGSMASLSYAMLYALVPALIATGALLGLMYFLRKR